MHDAKLRINRREGKENVQHKPIIEPTDLKKIQESNFMSMDNPQGLLRKVWFYVSLYWCQRGRERQQVQKNNQGGENSKPSSKNDTRLYSTGSESFACLKKYLSKLNPSCKAFFQRPKPNVTFDDQVCYENKPIGVNTLSKMMEDISIGCSLSEVYTNHSVRATAITIWSDADIPDRHITFVSGHSNEQSLAHYNRTPSAPQLRRFSDTMSSALGCSNTLDIYRPNVIDEQRNPPLPLQATTSTAVYSSSQTTMNAFPGGLFNSCSFGNTKVYIFSSKDEHLM
ncbi:hypothetical protein AC249_AIPGENE9445 [Exaiptasia diaphana]|nr:hypothetical protein AC249_AIPGENE9445 [Exaiptasia diaphana]